MGILQLRVWIFSSFSCPFFSSFFLSLLFYCLSDLEKKDNMFLYQMNINPPHFQVVFGQEILNLPKVRKIMVLI